MPRKNNITKKKYANLFVVLCLLFSMGTHLNAQDHSNFLNGLVSAYSLESPSAMTDEQGTNNGTVIGASLVAGNNGNALNFTGSQATMGVVPSSTSLDLNGTEMTMMVDIYPTANGQSGKSVIVQKGIGTGGDNIYSVSYTNTNTIRFRNHISAVRRDFTSTATAPLNTWSRIICVWKSGEARIIRINSATNTEAIAYTGTHSVSAGRDLTIGSYDMLAPSTTRSFVGRIDNVMIWDRALTTAEQNTLINENLEFSDFNAANSADTQAPTAPTLSSTGQSETTVDLTWSGATDNVGVTGYQIYRDGNPIATLGNITSYQVTGLTADTSYSFTATALDAAGNESPISNSASITTDASSSGGGNSGTSVWTEANSIASYSGKVQVGNITVPSEYAMAIDGKLITEEVRVELSGTWPDYVFTKDHSLPTLEEVQKHIQEKGHLPNMPSAKEVETNGIAVGEMNRLLLEKIEELTLYILMQQKEIENLKKR